MTFQNIFFFLFISSYCLGCSVRSDSQGLDSISEHNRDIKSRVFSPLIADKDFESGCGCSVQNSKGETVLFSALKKESPLIAKPNGMRRVFKFVSSSDGEKVSDQDVKFVRTYRDGGDKLSIEFIPGEICADGPSDCEVKNFSNNIKFESSTTNFELRDLKGDCGC